VSVNVYIEGAHKDSKGLQTQLRKAFSILLERAGIRRPHTPKLILCGSREETFKQFQTALRQSTAQSLLLIDAEGPVSGSVSGASAWRHLHQQDGWSRPERLDDDQVHLMVELMESWLLSNRGALARHFGDGFVASNLPGSETSVETIPKQRVLSGLEAATRRSQKGSYGKSRDSAELLESMDPNNLCKAAPYFARFLDVLRRSLAR
jgi:hypothetical protein